MGGLFWTRNPVTSSTATSSALPPRLVVRDSARVGGDPVVETGGRRRMRGSSRKRLYAAIATASAATPIFTSSSWP